MTKSKNKRKSGTGKKGSVWNKKVERLAEERASEKERRNKDLFEQHFGVTND